MRVLSPKLKPRLLWFVFCALALISMTSASAQAAPQTLSASKSESSTKAGSKWVVTAGNLPLSFEKNQGQSDSRVKFLSHGQGYTLFLNSTDAVFEFHAGLHKPQNKKESTSRNLVDLAANSARQSSVVRMELLGSNPGPSVTGIEELSVPTHYLIGNDPGKWHRSVPSFAKVKYSAIYPSIDLIYYGNQGQLEYDFVVGPGGDPKNISISFEGSKRVPIELAGDLLIATEVGEVRLRKPVMYQLEQGRHKQVKGEFVLRGRNIGVRVEAYNEREPLVIDPILAYSTYLGGSGEDFVNAMAVDSEGDAYITGFTASGDFPGNGNSIVAFVRKFNSNGSDVIYSTYLGGTGGDLGYGLALDALGNAYVTGVTSSKDFPVTWDSAYQTSLGPSASGNVFVAKLSADGQTLLYSSYFGGESFDFGTGITIGTNQSVYVTGGASSYSFPTTLNAFQSRLMSPNGNAFVARFDLTKAGANSLVYSSFLGGTSNQGIPDQAEAIAVDKTENVYLTGAASSEDFPITRETAYQTKVHPISSAFLTQIDTTKDGAAGLVYSTFLSGTDPGPGAFASGIAVDSCGKVYLAGGTSSLEFPTTTGVANSPNGKAFVAKFDTTQSKSSSLVYSTLIGGSGGEYSRALLVDWDGNSYISGWTNSSDFPVTDGAIQKTQGAGGRNIFLAVLNPDASTILYGTFLGGFGSRNEMVGGLAFDAGHNIYVSGRTSSADFQTTPGSYQQSLKGVGDGFIAKLKAIQEPTAHPICGPRRIRGSSSATKGEDFGPTRDGNGVFFGGAETPFIFSWALAAASLAFAAHGRTRGKRCLSDKLAFTAVIMAVTVTNGCGVVSGVDSPGTLPATGTLPPTHSGPLRLLPPGDPIPGIFFGMHFHRLASTTPWPIDVPVGSWRLHDAYVDWPHLEPSRDNWDFKNLDLYLNLAEQHGVPVLLPFVLCPPWASSRPSEPSGYSPGNAAVPKDLGDWRNYVRTVAIRYKGRIHEYEIWNEPNLKDFYTGSVPQLVDMARIAYTTLKEIDPTILVSSPSFTGTHGVSWLDQYLQTGGGEYADLIGYHLYVNPAPPEEMVPLTQQVQTVMSKHGVRNKELWDTETGWAIQNTLSVVVPASGKGFNSIVLSPDAAAGYLVRTYILSWALQVSRLYWYAWDDDVMGLTETDGKTLKAPAVAYGEIQKWLVGARMTSCAVDSNQTWVCTLSRHGGYSGWIVWNPNQTEKFELPRDWNATRVRYLRGAQQEISLKTNIEIGPSPILLESAAN